MFKDLLEYLERYKRPAIIAGVAALVVIVVLGILIALSPSKESPFEQIEQAITSEGDEGNPLRKAKLYVNPESNAAKQANEWRASRPEQAVAMDKLAQMPTARWINSPNDYAPLQKDLQTAAEDNRTLVVVSYFILNRDCGNYSAGGAKSADEYRQFVDGVAERLGNNKAIVILEPDALSQLKTRNDNGQVCLTPEQQIAYFELLNYAVQKYKALPEARVYIDAGNSSWITDPNEVADRLNKAGVDKADGFSLNVSNFIGNEETVAFGTAISQKTNGKHFVVDTSRNGLGAFENQEVPTHNWCNPPGRALGHYPTVKTGNPLTDAFLFIKYPGESDGTDPDPRKCFGGPRAGAWWPDYALGLIERWPEDLQP